MRETNEDISGLDQVDDEPLLDEQSSKRFRQRFHKVLQWGSLALFLVFLVRVSSVFLEGRPKDPIWQSEFVDVLVNQGLVAFLGFVFLHLAVLIQGKDSQSRSLLRLVRRLSWIPLVGYLLLVPLQLFSSYSELSAVRQKKANYMSESSHLSEVREAIEKAKNKEDLNVRFQYLKEPEITEEQFALGFPELRDSLIKVNTSRQVELVRLTEAVDGTVDSIGVIFARLGTALAWALAFSSGVVFKTSRRSAGARRVRRR